MNEELPRISRRALFDLVWSKPMTTIARDYGTTNAHVAALAKRLELEVPKGGHWMKAEVGKAPHVPAYAPDPAHEDLLHEITRPTPRASRINSGVAQISSVNDVLSTVVQPRIAVHEKESSPIPIAPDKRLASTQTALRKAKVGERLHVDGRGRFRLVVSQDCSERALSILDALLKAADQRGWSVRDGEKGRELLVDDEAIGFMIEEQLRAEPHIPTPAELHAQADYERQCALADRGIGYRPWRAPQVPKHDHVPTGELTLRLDDSYTYSGQRRTFSDGKRQRLDAMIDVVAETIAKCSEAIKARRASDEERKRQWAEEEQRRRQDQNRIRVNGYRIVFLQRQIERQREIAELDGLIDLWQRSNEVDEAFAKLLDFARAYRRSLAEKLEPAAIAARLIKLRLMDEDVTIYDTTQIG